MASGAEADDAAGLAWPRRPIAVAAVLMAMALAVLDGASVNVALPSIAQSLHVTAAVSVRVVTAYQAALLMALLPCAAFGESFGYRRLFAAGLALFIGASAWCAAAPSLPWLIAGRFAQGLGGAAVMALGVALLRHSVAADRLGAAIGWNAATVALCSAAGPAIGALVLSSAGWHWLFLAYLPLGLAALAATRGLPEVAPSGRRPDVASMALLAAGFAALILGAQMLGARPEAGVPLLASAGLCLMATLRRERLKTAPLLPLDLLRMPAFRTSVTASVFCFAGQTLGLIALPFHLRHALGLSPWLTGLLMVPWPLAVMASATVAGRLADRFPARRLCVTGGATLAAGLAGLALVPPHNGTAALVALAALCGLGFGLFQVANNRTMFLAAPRERAAAAGGMQGTARLTGQTAGSVAASLLFAAASFDMGPRIGMGIGAILVAAAALVSLSGARSTAILPRRTAPPPQSHKA